MSQLKNIRLLPHKGLRSAELRDLQRINVLCGPNNSGKTTVLECIATTNLRQTGIPSDPEVGRRLAEQTVHNSGWANTNRTYDERYFSVLQNAWQSRPVWFAGEFGHFWEGIGKVWRQNFGNFATPDFALGKFFEQLFASAPKTVLVPAKRKLETTKAVNSSEEIQNDGDRNIKLFVHGKKPERIGDCSKTI